MMLIYAAFLSERFKYILNELFVYRLGIDFKYTDNLLYFKKSQTFKLNYSNEIIEGCINIPETGFLYEEDILVQELTVDKDSAWQYIFFKKPFELIPDFRTNTAFLSFDIFASVFYLLSRYEEYLPSVKDEHNRYKEQNSIAFKNGFLEIPLVDYWVIRFREIITMQYSSIVFKLSVFKQINSIDVDFAYKYKGLSKMRLIKKSIGSLMRSEKVKNIFHVSSNDPYDTYDYMIKKAASENIECIFFFLLADYGGWDKSHSPQSPEFITLINFLSQNFVCGIHPSYRSSTYEMALRNELDLFLLLTKHNAVISRNHFLKIKIPETYTQLSKFNIEKDYSLGYSNHVGFRASTSIPFRFFNLHTNTVTPLLIQPFCLMDVTLKNGMQLQPDAAILKIRELKKQVKTVEGTFVSIWHNSSFDDTPEWQGWDKVYESLFDK